MAREQRDGLVAIELRSRGGIELPGRSAFLAEKAADLVSRRIPVLPIIVKPDPAAAPPKHERRAKTRRAPSHNDDIITFGRFPLPSRRHACGWYCGAQFAANSVRNCSINVLAAQPLP